MDLQTRTSRPQDQANGTRKGVSMQDILLLIGQLNYTWTNTESLLIYLIAGLARVDKETAIVIFLTLNTTRARIDLVERLAKMSKTPQPLREEILALTSSLGREAALRNKFNHCMDDREIARIQTCISSITAINRRIWALVRRHGFPV